MLEYHQPPPPPPLVLARVLKVQLCDVRGPEERLRGERPGWCGEDGEDGGLVISELSLAGLAWTATGTISPCQHDTAANC